MKRLLLALLLSPMSVCLADDEPPVTPYRPSVSTPAQLPAAGQLELETGFLHLKDQDFHRTSLPWQLKLAFDDKWGVLLGGEAHVAMRDAAGSLGSGVGDTTLVLKRAFAADETTAFGLELGTRMPTANERVGNGKHDYTVNTIASKDIGKVHIDANLNATRLGLDEPGLAHTQTGLSASFSMPVDEKWTATAEVSGTHRGGAVHTGQLLMAATYGVSKRMTLDFGLARGLNDASGGWSVFGGIVVPVARLW